MKKVNEKQGVLPKSIQHKREVEKVLQIILQSFLNKVLFLPDLVNPFRVVDARFSDDLYEEVYLLVSEYSGTQFQSSINISYVTIKDMNGKRFAAIPYGKLRKILQLV